MNYLLSINGFKVTFKVYKIGSNIDFNDRFSILAYLRKHYSNFTAKMTNQILRGEYTVTPV